MRVKILTAVVFKPAVIHSKSKHFGGHLGTWKWRPNSKWPGGGANGPGGSWAKMHNMFSIFISDQDSHLHTSHFPLD